MLDDALLLARWVDRGDAEAFAELAQRHAGLVYGTCRRVVQDHHIAEDVAQECLLELARGAASVRTSVAGFLHNLAFSRARNRLRQDRARQHREAIAGVDQSAADSAEPTWAELAPVVDEALASLTDEERLPLILHFFEGQSQAQLAKQLGCDPATVSRRMARSIAALRERLGGNGIRISGVLLAGMLTANATEVATPALIAAASKMALAGIGKAAPVSLAMGAAQAAAPVALSKLAIAAVTTVACTVAGITTYQLTVKSTPLEPPAAIAPPLSTVLAPSVIGTPPPMATATESPAAMPSVKAWAGWENHAFTTQYGTFTAEFDAIPSQLGLDTGIGLSNGVVGSYRDLACVVRFNSDNFIDARNGGDYGTSSLAYTAGVIYHFRLVIRVAQRTYDIFVTPQGGSEIAVGLGYAFRSEQSAVASLDHWAKSDELGASSVMKFSLTGSAGP